MQQPATGEQPQPASTGEDADSEYSYYSGSSYAATPKKGPPLAPPSEPGSEYSYESGSEYTAEELPPPSARPGDRGGLVGWLSRAAAALVGGPGESGPEEKRGILFTPRDAQPPRRHVARARRVASIPWKEFVGLKESLLVQMEGTATAVERLDERTAVGEQYAEALTRAGTQLDDAMRELRAVAEADAAETAEITASLRLQVQQLNDELGAVEAEQRVLTQQAERGGSRAAAATVVSEAVGRGEEVQTVIEPTSPGPYVSLMLTSRGPHVILVRQAKLREASRRTRTAQQHAAVQGAALSAEIRMVETQLSATLASSAAAPSRVSKPPSSGSDGGAGVSGSPTDAAAVGERLQELAQSEAIEEVR